MIYNKAKTFLKQILRLNKKRQKNIYSGNYISAYETIDKAKELNLSVTEYVEQLWEQTGDSKKLIFDLEKIGFFKQDGIILEIGAGTGRYIGHIVSNFDPKVIYSYETALDWREYLDYEYSNILISRDSDGFSLKFEENNTIDNLLAHGVFVYLPFLNAFKYFNEIIRVVKKGGLVTFDIYCAEDWSIDTINIWLEKGNHFYPVIFQKKIVIDYFNLNGFSLIDSFNKKNGYTFSTYLVFKKNDRKHST